MGHAIGKQVEHHQRRTFEQEFIALLDRHGVEYDPAHLAVGAAQSPPKGLKKQKGCIRERPVSTGLRPWLLSIAPGGAQKSPRKRDENPKRENGAGAGRGRHGGRTRYDAAIDFASLGALEAHPENSNRMPPRLLVKLKAHIQRTGLYEPLVVRPMKARFRIADFGLRSERQTTAGTSGGELGDESW